MCEKERRKWQTILTVDFMSSEESDSEDEKVSLSRRNSPGDQIVSMMFSKLDAVVDEGKSKFAKKQMHKHIVSGQISTRTSPQENMLF